MGELRDVQLLKRAHDEHPNTRLWVAPLAKTGLLHLKIILCHIGGTDTLCRASQYRAACERGTVLHHVARLKCISLNQLPDTYEKRLTRAAANGRRPRIRTRAVTESRRPVRANTRKEENTVVFQILSKPCIEFGQTCYEYI